MPLPRVLVFDEVIVRLHLNCTARGRCHYHSPPSGFSRQVLHLCLPRHINIISFSLLLRQEFLSIYMQFGTKLNVEGRLEKILVSW